jgi:hypothetical protein
MDHTIRMKALGYAAKVAIGAAFVAGCSSGSSESDTATDNGSALSDDQIIEGDPACKDGLAKLKEAFPDGDHQWFSHPEPDETLKGDEAVTACCESIIKGPSSVQKIAKFRGSGCCAADFPDDNDAKLSACTPWGPPVPPSMKWVA